MKKSYTDLEQSKKLSEILSLDSADMARCGGENVIMTDYISAKKKFSVCGELTITPCWSLAALLDVLPILERKGYQKAKPRLLYNVAINKWIVDSHIYTTDAYDNPVDACVDMILLLKEKNLI